MNALSRVARIRFLALASILILVANYLLLKQRALLPTVTPMPMASATTLQVNEVAVISIPISGPVSLPDAEISGMAWYNNTLILLPQYPSRFMGTADGALFGINKADLMAFLSGQTTSPLEPFEIPFYASDIPASIPGFEGFEAIAFWGDQVFLSIEANPGAMAGYMVSGTINSNLSEVRLNPDSLIKNSPIVNISNMSDEAILVYESNIITFFEGNGASVNSNPSAHIFSLTLQPDGALYLPNLEYRLTDVTPPDDEGRFWAINYFYPGEDAIRPIRDPLASQYGEGSTHRQFETVERLVEFQINPEGITFSGSPPIQLQLLDDDQPRNWEAIARLDDIGFLLATDKYPETILAFVPYP